MASIDITQDFSKVKKIVSGTGLTKRQIIAFISGGAAGLPVYFLLKNKFQLDVSMAMIGLVAVAGSIIYLLLYEKDGMHIERHISFYYETYFVRNTDRPYKTQNLYEFMQKEQNLQKEIEKIVFKGKTEEEIIKAKKSGENSEVKIGKKRIKVPIKGPVDWKTKRELVKAVKKAKLQGEIPESAQESIPYEKPFEDGIFESAPGYYTQTIAFEDITYQLLDPEPKDLIFERWSLLINFFDENRPFQFCYGNMEINKEEYAKDFTIPKDSADSRIKRIMRNEYSEHQVKQFAQGTNNLKKIRNLTFGVYAKDYPTAKRKLSKDAKQIQKIFKKLGSKCKILNGYERLELLFKIFHPETKEKFLWNFDMPVKTGLSSKDFIAPSSFCFKPGADFNATKYFKVGDRIGAVSYIQIFANEMDDRIVAEILDMNSNVWLSFHGKTINRIQAIDYAKDNINDIQKMIVSANKDAVQGGYDMDHSLPPELLDYKESGEQLFRDIRRRDQQMINTTITVVQTAKTRKELEDNILELENILGGFQCKLIRLDNRQEQGYMSSLPLGNNQLEVKRTFTTSDLAIFIPFTTKEMYTNQGQYYGMNSLSNNVIMVDKKKLVNPNTLILGAPGFGKSFFTKKEILDIYLKTHDDILIIDPEGEYKWLVKALGGQVVEIALNSPVHINFMEIDLERSNEEDIDYEPIAAKCNFIVSVCELILGRKGELNEDEKAVIDHACNNIYKRYTKNPQKENMPIPEDLYYELRSENMPEDMKKFGRDMSVALARYVSGSLNYFNHRSNIDIHSRLVCFDLKNMDKKQKELTMLIIEETMWDRVAANRAREIYTRTIFDEFHILLKEPKTAEYVVELWKRLRKWGGIPLGITQNVKDLFRSKQIENILDTTNCMIMLNQLGDDARILSAHLDLSVEETGYIQSGEIGKGLIWVENTKVPFEDHFPENTLCYKIMTTKPEEAIAM